VLSKGNSGTDHRIGIRQRCRIEEKRGADDAVAGTVVARTGNESASNVVGGVACRRVMRGIPKGLAGTGVALVL
jgi:hypothetical protein